MYEVIRRGKRHNISIECLLDLFDKMAKPILYYTGCEVWGFSDNYVIEKIHFKFRKLILHLKQSTPNVMIYGELDRFPLYIDIKTRVISYWCKLLSGKASKLSAISYKLLHSFFCNGNISAPWVKFVKDILDNCGLSNVWTFQNINFNTEHRYVWTGPYVAPLFFLFLFRCCPPPPFFFEHRFFFHINNILQLSMYHCMTYIQ